MQYIKNLEKSTLSTEQLKLLVGPQNAARCRWLVWDDLSKFSTAEELMSLGAVVILLQIESRNAPRVGHFILLLNHGEYLEHFDSYGLTMEEELSVIHEHHLTRIFDKYRKRIINNTAKLQTLRQDINTCGRWVVARLLLRDKDLDSFLSIVKSFGIRTDETVSLMTMLLGYKR